ncbi:16S rRNA (guanine(966)-N(2))-methyltransferase RsmD [Litoreibacter roseus]|uniref:Methyltransferase n=1 Tax=Litoreibacter roseus TaxID=2601869 RepID=A0A6N6JEU9_9RHOB|nr:16S rRNA (guanine(966)-N(2))-methyltransferase RsmD [Litoreibacter roseus]GFE64756.1 methyltransferase [Litoreibacter roseus]
MRIVAGRFRGRALAAVGKGDAAAHLRPTADRVRESLFNVLGGGKFAGTLEHARVLDLFAGTGALGLEALSRGADHVTFVDSGRKALALLRENIRLLDVEADARVLTSDARRLPQASAPCDLIFLDPPYGQNLGKPALAKAAEMGWIDANALVVWEEKSPQDAPEGYTREDNRRYGDTHISIMRRGLA